MNINREYKISIAEPWNFESPDGKNLIKGIILSIVDETCLVFKANYLLNFSGAVGNILILSPRTKNNNFNNSGSIDVNGGLLSVEYKNELNKSELKNNSRFVLIGTVEG